MNWITLTGDDQLQTINERSSSRPQVIFKHSTRCSISSIVKSRIDRNPEVEGVDFYFLDIIQNRHISNKIASDYAVHHESPQVLVIQDGKCVYDESHTGIHMDEIVSAVTAS